MALHKWRKWLSAALVCLVLAGGGAAYAESETGGADQSGTEAEAPGGADTGQPSGPGSGFPDVPNNHWAKKHITKLYLQGIVKGNDQGLFVPGSSVSQQDAVLMALRFTGAADKVDPGTQVLFPDSFIVAPYAKPYVMQAIYEGLLEEQEEFRLAESDPDTAWGSKPATREWVTKLIVRAIGETDKAEARAHDLPAFADASLIADNYVGYVNAAVELGIVKGISADRFAPKNTVTRAELATMLSRAQYLHPVAYDRQHSGVLTVLDGTRLTLAGEDGSTKTFTLGPDTAYYRFDSESASSPANLKLYTQATVIAEGGRALYVEQLDSEERLEKTTGTVVSVDEGERVLYIKVGSRVLTIPYESGLAVLDRGGANVGLSALAENSEADIYRETFSETQRAVRIELKSAPANKQGKGKIVNVQPGVIEIVDDGAEQAEKWDIAAAAVISRQGSPATLSDLRSGDVVSYTVESGAVTQITVESGASRTVSGQFDSYDAARGRIVYMAGGRLEISDLAPGATLEIPGFSAATWTDLYKDDQLELTLDGSDKVTKVKVSGRNILTVNGASIVSLNDNLLTFRDPNGRPGAVELNSKTRIEMNNSAVTLEAARSLFVAGRKVALTYSEDQAIVVRFAYRYAGTLTTLDTAGSRIVLKLDDGSTVTVSYQTPAVQIYGKTSASLSDLKAGDRITVQLDQNLDKAVVVMAHRVVQMKVASVDASARKARLTSEAGVTSEYAISADVRILDESGNSLTLAQLAAGKTVNVEFAGSELVRMQTVIVKVGKIVSTAPGAVTLAEYGGPTQDIPLGANFKIVKNGVASTSTAALSANDRVEIRTNESGEYVVTVIAGVVKTFWKFDAAANEILVRKTSLNEPNQYKLASDTLITSGGQPVAVTSLKTDDKIALYILNGKLLEVEKV
jgi:hypothetical protein